jgi:hypothetical protein
MHHRINTGLAFLGFCLLISCLFGLVFGLVYLFASIS